MVLMIPAARSQCHLYLRPYAPSRPGVQLENGPESEAASMLRHTANPAAFFHLSPYMAEQSNIGLPACNCGGGQRSSFELFGRPNGAAVAGHFRSQNADEEVMIDSDAAPLVVVRSATTLPGPGRLLSEAIAAAESRRSTATLDGDFGRYLEAVINSHPEPLRNPWD